MDDVNNIRWWHCIDLGNGIITKGQSLNIDQLNDLNIPDDLTGKTVLDIGAWDGYFSFVAEERGAIVTATDSANHSWGKVGTGKAGFDLAKKLRNSKVNEYISDVYDLDPSIIGTFDIVFCFGVLYHVKGPYTLLEKIFDLTNELAIIETVSNNNMNEKRIIEYYRLQENNDPSNYFSLNALCLIKMLEHIGFTNIFIPQGIPNTNDFTRLTCHAYK